MHDLVPSLSFARRRHMVSQDCWSALWDRVTTLRKLAVMEQLYSTSPDEARPLSHKPAKPLNFVRRM